MLKLLNVIDEFTRECPGHRRGPLHRRRRRGGRASTAWPPTRGAPVYVRFDHGPEFIAYAVADWCRFNGTGTIFIDPGSPGRTPGSRASTAGCATST